MNPLASLLQHYPVLVADGALATQLERRGCDLRDPLWSGKVLIETPELIRQVDRDYFEAGQTLPPGRVAFLEPPLPRSEQKKPASRRVPCRVLAIIRQGRQTEKLNSSCCSCQGWASQGLARGPARC
jgi:hypothetical protein